MAKTKIIGLDGSNKGEIELPRFFREKIRQDLIMRAFLSLQISHSQPYGAYVLAGKEVSASGKQSHRRRKYKTLYGHGISRVPRKVLTRRGERFFWVGAFAAGTVGGKAAHPPRAIQKFKKINKKEKKKAFVSALAATTSIELLKKKYEKYKDNIKVELPFILEKVEGKNKEIEEKIENLLSKKLGDFSKRLIGAKRKIRAGKGKRRNRKYKKKSGMLLVISSEEKKKKINLDNYGIETIEVKKLGVNHLAPGGIPGRFAVYTNQAIAELKEKIEGEKK
jgi:large subunit ribosomal protein L4e